MIVITWRALTSRNACLLPSSHCGIHDLIGQECDQNISCSLVLILNFWFPGDSNPNPHVENLAQRLNKDVWNDQTFSLFLAVIV